MKIANKQRGHKIMKKINSNSLKIKMEMKISLMRVHKKMRNDDILNVYK